ncbi:MAG: zf-HC2 domain-containing protein [Bacteroidetes bacterium]|nr:zf-HC2 domain-containing protein [Bacteroidota bacterium]
MMKCELASELIIDRLTGNLSGSEEKELSAHLDSCDSCREAAKQLRTTWLDLGRLSVPSPRSDGLKRLSGRLSVGRIASPRRVVISRVAIAASLGVAILIGYVTGRTASPPASESVAGSEFMFLLREPAQPLEELVTADITEIVREYQDWATDLARAGQLIGARKLADEPDLWLVGTSGNRSGPNLNTWPRISGYFVVAAADLNAAITIARNSPHLKYGGAIEVRSIDMVAGGN